MTQVVEQKRHDLAVLEERMVGEPANMVNYLRAKVGPQLERGGREGEDIQSA